VQLLPHRPAVDERDRWPQHARASGAVHLGGPRRLGHVNSLTPDLAANEAFYVEALGMRVSDRLGEAGVWFHTGPEHHVMALVGTGQAHFHHLAFDVVDIGKMRDVLDHRYSSNTWGPLPPRSYFRFDPVAVESERESWETRGRLLPPPEAA